MAGAERRVAEAQAGEELREARKAKAAATRKKIKKPRKLQQEFRLRTPQLKQPSKQ